MEYFREGVAYLQVRRDGRWNGASKLKVVKSTQRRPEVIEPDCVVVAIKLRVPNAAFDPLQPEAVVTVPADLVQQPIAVEAVNHE